MTNYDTPDNPLLFFCKVFIGVVGGLVLGSIIDWVFRILQKDDRDWKTRSLLKSILYFILQISVNIIILLFLCIIFPIRFIEWLQLTVSGALFAVLLFLVQRNLVDNTLRITAF